MYWWHFFSHIAGKEQVFIFIQFRSFEFCIAPVRTGISDIIIILWCTVNKSATIFMVCINSYNYTIETTSKMFKTHQVEPWATLVSGSTAKFLTFRHNFYGLWEYKPWKIVVGLFLLMSISVDVSQKIAGTRKRKPNCNTVLPSTMVLNQSAHEKPFSYCKINYW